jgi:hypothetical protein
MNKYVIIVSILIGLVLGFFAGEWWVKKDILPPSPAVFDTLYVTIPAIPETVVVKATITKTVHDTIHGQIGINFARAVKTFDGYGEFDVSYFFPPQNEFVFLFKPFPRVETIITKTIYLPRYVERISWYNDPWLNRSIGFGFGIGAAILIHKGLK